MSNEDHARLAEIKVRYSEGWPSSNRRLADIGWLIAEVDRLRNERASYIADAATAIAEMRAETVAALAAAVEGDRAAYSIVDAEDDGDMG